jgi:hypothetical protein
MERTSAADCANCISIQSRLSSRQDSDGLGALSAGRLLLPTMIPRRLGVRPETSRPLTDSTPRGQQNAPDRICEDSTA